MIVIENSIVFSVGIIEVKWSKKKRGAIDAEIMISIAINPSNNTDILLSL